MPEIMEYRVSQLEKNLSAELIKVNSSLERLSSQINTLVLSNGIHQIKTEDLSSKVKEFSEKVEEFFEEASQNKDLLAKEIISVSHRAKEDTSKLELAIVSKAGGAGTVMGGITGTVGAGIVKLIEMFAG